MKTETIKHAPVEAIMEKTHKLVDEHGPLKVSVMFGISRSTLWSALKGYTRAIGKIASYYGYEARTVFVAKESK